MPTPDPPTPTHEEAREIVASDPWFHDRPRHKLHAYIEHAESTAAELLKARERIAELHAIGAWGFCAGHETHEGTVRCVSAGYERRAEEHDAMNAALESARERIAELEREVARLRAPAPCRHLDRVTTSAGDFCDACGAEL